MAREKFFQQPSVMSSQAHFAQVPSAEIQRSTFDRSHGLKTTFDAGQLIPIYLDEVLPGDTFTMKTTSFARLTTPLKPIMDNLYIDLHYFFVPNRLLFDQWEEFMGERPTPDFDPDTVQLPVMPWNVPTTVSTNQTIMKYMGLPQRRRQDDDFESVSCFPIRAYRLIYNEWYRDQNLQEPVPMATGAYDNAADLDAGCFYRGKRHDYFTSCLPWPQKGDPVTIPIGGTAPVVAREWLENGSPFVFKNSVTFNEHQARIVGDGATSGNVQYMDTGAVWETLAAERLLLTTQTPIADAMLDELSAISINQLRTAFQIQRMLERDARGGTRYIELILSHFGVRSDDARLQRPEYLGGGSSRININPIASTAVVPDEAPQANLAAIGTVVANAKFQKSFTEHGLIIGLASVRADLTYQRCIERMWSRKTRYDFYWPALAHLGEQAVLNKEIYYTGLESVDNAVFGYQERFAEYRYKPSLITGVFNSDASESLDVWHLAQEFDDLPTLSDDFIKENPPIPRISALSGISNQQFLCDIWHDLKCARPMPVYSVPGLIDHF